MGNKCVRSSWDRTSVDDDLDMMEAYLNASDLDWSSEFTVRHRSHVNSLHNKSLARMREKTFMRARGTEVRRNRKRVHSVTFSDSAPEIFEIEYAASREPEQTEETPDMKENKLGGSPTNAAEAAKMIRQKVDLDLDLGSKLRLIVNQTCELPQLNIERVHE
eukprot:CAMPEP_0202823246 /NCGR_PEP_ID=MMETSP1389-20130828/11611_1 /ASSEMBLY_ACC=CAM_ASM_000865 /TAXON_ID=302021 /ORGANISM="Rhodomonas sp., Strain CCMP768" /LENGTH=161 /DNA_ID=CAMNT_0049496239 /DNA_START=91 /DNA_END=576 /DNA_ORIENTATION=+